MAGGRSTINTVLKSGATTEALTKLCRIKTYPQLGGEPEQIETTDLEDTMQTFVDGVQQMETMQFTINYEKEAYDDVKARIATDKYFQLAVAPDFNTVLMVLLPPAIIIILSTP